MWRKVFFKKQHLINKSSDAKHRAHAASKAWARVGAGRPNRPPAPATTTNTSNIPSCYTPRRASGTTSSPTDDSALPVGATLGIALRVTKRKDIRRSYHHKVIHEKNELPHRGIFRPPDIHPRKRHGGHRQRPPTGSAHPVTETRDSIAHKKRNRNRTDFITAW